MTTPTTTQPMPERILVTDAITATAAWQPADTTWDFGAYKNHKRTEYIRSDLAVPQDVLQQVADALKVCRGAIVINDGRKDRGGTPWELSHAHGQAQQALTALTPYLPGVKNVD